MKTRQFLLGKLKKALNYSIKAGETTSTIALVHEIERLGDIPEQNELLTLKKALSELEERSQIWDSALNVRQVAPPGNGRISIQRQ